MTDDECISKWLVDEDFDFLLDFLDHMVTPSRRKLRLFAVACCRSVWEQITDEVSRHAIELAERLADGRTTLESLNKAHLIVENASRAAWGTFQGGTPIATRALALAHSVPALAALVTKEPFDEIDVKDTVDAAIGVVMHSAIPEQEWGTAACDAFAENAIEREHPRQVQLFRDIFGNPFCPLPFLAPAVLAWNDGTVRRIAEGIYDEWAFDRLPILADALLDASCDNDDLIQHCRSAGPHVRGCWAVDLILGRS